MGPSETRATYHAGGDPGPAGAGGRAAAPGVHIREVRGGGVCLVGAAEREVACKAEMAAVLEQARCSPYP